MNYTFPCCHSGIYLEGKPSKAGLPAAHTRSSGSSPVRRKGSEEARERLEAAVGG